MVVVPIFFRYIVAMQKRFVCILRQVLEESRLFQCCFLGITEIPGVGANIDKGNIYIRMGLGAYEYGSARPHTVTAATNASGLVSAQQQDITYTDFHKVKTISENGYLLDIDYGPDRQREKTTLKYNNSIKKTVIYAGNYERITKTDTVTHLYYIAGGEGFSGIYVKQTRGATTLKEGMYYTHTDHLGSIMSITDNAGSEVFKASYDAWGKQTVTNSTFKFHRGFTGHEHLTEFGLINMNGRMYDPIIGRFLSPDPFVQFPDFSQSYNRYSYCLNNPLIYTDPDGEIAWLIPVAIIVVKAGINVYKNWDHIKAADGGWQTAGRIVGYTLIGAADGALSYLVPEGGSILGGMLRDGLNGAMRGYSLREIGIDVGISFTSNIIGYGVGEGFSELTKLGLSASNITSPLINSYAPKIIKNITGDYVTNTMNFYMRHEQDTNSTFRDAVNYAAKTENILASVASGVVEGSIDYFKYKQELKRNSNTPTTSPSPLDINKSNTSPTFNAPPASPLSPIPDIHPTLTPTPIEIFLKSPVPSKRPRGRYFDDLQGRWIYF